MYIQITTRCNMSCAHCCFACTEDGEDMSEKVFLEALKLCGEYTVIGGGEPTLHPKFKDYLMQAMCEGDVWLATNGSQTKISLLLAKLAAKGVIGCALSVDEYHDYIDPEVIQAFTTEGDDSKDLRECRDVSDSIAAGGRATENGFAVTDYCGCTGGIIKPNGDIYLCACDNAPKIGTVWGFTYPDWYEEYNCYTEYVEDN